MTSTVNTFTVDPVAPTRLSMSFMRAGQGCLRRAHMERECDLAGVDAVVGRVFHEVAATAGLAATFTGEATVDRDEAERIAIRVMEQPEENGPLPVEAWEQVLQLVRWWAPRVEVKPGERFEVTSRVMLSGRTLSARIDRLWIDGTTAEVEDYKTGWGDPASQLPFQGKVYAWHVLAANPQVDRVLYREDYVRHGVPSPWWEITRHDADRIERYLRALIRRVDQAYAAGTLTATPGAVCSTPSRCPVAESCPAPAWARPETVIETREQAEAELEQILVNQAADDQRKRKIRGWLEHTGERAIAAGGKEYGRAAKPGNRLDKKALQADLAIQRGEPVDLAEYTTQTPASLGLRNA